MSHLNLLPMAQSNVGVRCDFDVDIRKFHTDGSLQSERRVLTKCPNLITNLGMDAFGEDSTQYFARIMMAYLQVGTSTTPPEFTDTVLGTRVTAVGPGGTGDNAWAWDTTNNHILVYTRVYQFGVGAAAGALKELGLSASTTGSVFTRALFKDAFGDPMTVNVAADEQLVVTYRLYFTANESDYVFVTVQNGIEYTVTTRVAGLSTSTAPLDQYWATLSGIAVGYSNGNVDLLGRYGVTSGLNPVTSPDTTGTDAGYIYNGTIKTAYVPGSYYVDQSVTIGLNQFNVNDLGAFLFLGSPFRVQMSVSPRINKTSNDTIKITMRTSWSRT